MTVLVGCDDGSSKPRSADDVVLAIEAPTGTVSADTAPAVAGTFQRGRDLEPAVLTKSASGSFDVRGECPSGGAASSHGEADGSHGEFSVDFDACCLGPCCKSGTFTAFADRVAGEGDVSYSSCVSYDFTKTCGSSSLHLSGEGCIDASGSSVRVVDIDGRTFTVTASGAFHGGEGELEIRGSNGSFTCHFKRGGGNCSGDVSFSF